MKAVRVQLHAIDADEGNDFTIDMILDDQNLPREKIPFCGWWGRLRTNFVYMFVVLQDGRVDFGSDEETSETDRWGHINFHGRKIEPGELITYRDDVDWPDGLMLKIGRVIDLFD